MPYAVGYASGRGKCNNKKGKAKGDFPLSNSLVRQVQSLLIHAARLIYWTQQAVKHRKHWECITETQEKNLRKRFNIENVNDLAGYADLKDVDKARVDALLGICIVRPPESEETSDPSENSKKVRMPKAALPGTNLILHVQDASSTGTKGTGSKATPISKSDPAPVPSASTSASTGKNPQSGSVPRPKPKPKVDLPQPGKSTPSEDLKELGNMHFRNGSYEIAIDMYTQAIALKPDSTYYTNRAAAYMELKRFQWVLDDCEAAILLQGQAPSSKTLARLARCHLILGDPEAALKFAQAAIDSDPISSAHPALLTKASAEQMKQNLHQSRRAWGEKRWSDAKNSLDEAVALCEGDYPSQWWVWEIEIEMARSNWDEALTLVEKVEKLYPDSVKVQVASAQVSLFTGRLASCYVYLRSALQKDPENLRAAALLQRLKAIDQAQQEGDRLSATFASVKYTEVFSVVRCLEEEGHGGHLRFNLLARRADAYIQQKSLNLARADCRAAMSIPNHPPPLKVWNILAKCHIALGNPRAALQVIEPAVELNRRDIGILITKSSAEKMKASLQLSREAWAKKDWLKAKDTLARAEAECTGDCLLQWWIWKVEMAMAMMDWEEAVHMGGTAIQLFSDSPDAFAILGLALMLSDKLDFCSESLQSALFLDLDHPLAFNTLCRVREIKRLREEGNQAFRFGRYPEAIQRYTETLNIIGNNDEEGGGGYIRGALLSNRAVALLKIKRHARALADIKASLELQPTSFKTVAFRRLFGISIPAAVTWR
ncbi:hypothetical protein FRB94_010818 [Tulasnella sp. JGI-2019a]|nr:hypothetical protein FRB94_010818 [Tulasnella sp. JGI-2019a]